MWAWMRQHIGAQLEANLKLGHVRRLKLLEVLESERLIYECKRGLVHLLRAVLDLMVCTILAHHYSSPFFVFSGLFSLLLPSR